MPIQLVTSNKPGPIFLLNSPNNLVRRGNLQKDITILITKKSQKMKIKYNLLFRLLKYIGSYTAGKRKNDINFVYSSVKWERTNWFLWTLHR
jgi:hypothetical protein